MRIIYLYIFLFGSVSLFSQSKKHLYTDKQVKIEYHTKNGMMDGKYISHYANGKVKAEGHFKNNIREGKWIISDSTGKVHFDYVSHLDTLKRNTKGYFDLLPLNANDVLMEKRVWRTIHPENNTVLFSHLDLFDSLYLQIQKDSLVVYRDDEFQKIRNKEEIDKNFSSEKYQIAGYKLKEDWFFDQKTGNARSQVIGLYIVLKPRKPESEDNIGLGWIYYPSVRTYLAKETVSEKNLPIHNLDDIFCFHYLSTQIYKEANVYDRPIAAYEKTEEGIAKEAERIELSMIEMEHDMWINLKKL